MTSNHNNTLFYKYKEIRSSLDLPVKLVLYFDLLEHSLTQKFDEKQLRKKQAFATQFIRGFMTLSKNQKQLMLFQTAYNLKKFCQTQFANDSVQQKQKMMNKNHQHGSMQKDQQNIEQKCKVSGQIFGVPYWYNADFYLNSKKKHIMIMTKHSDLIDLRLYLVRHSKKHQNTLVLESISNLTEKHINKVSLYFKQEVFSRIYQTVSQCIIKYRNEQIINLYVEGKKKSFSELPYITDEEFQLSYANRPLVFLNQKNINQYLHKRGLINIHLMNLQEKHFPIYQNNLYTIYKCSQDTSLYKLQSKMNMDQASAKKKFIESLKHYKFINFWQILQSFSVKYQTVLQKYKFLDKKFTQIMIKQVNVASVLTEEVLFLNHVDNIINKSFMEFCSFRIRQLDKKNSKLIIIGCFNPHLLGGISTLMLLLQEYVLMMDRTQKPVFQVTTATKEEYHSILQSFLDNNNEEKNQEKVFQLNQVQNIQNNLNISPSSISKKKKDQILSSSQNYLNHHYIMSPLNKNQVQENKQKQNFIYSEWRRAKNGGLVCVDEEKLNQQKVIGKKILAKFGDQLFKGKGLLNISLPVEIFKKQSQLQSLAKNFTFAPQIMESALLKDDHIQILKSATALLLTINILGLNYQKPFNPILGETFQCSINGCPLYLQQISHHPPISAYYFIGRGYKLYGTVQPKISLGMNGAKGYSDNPHTLQLDNGTIMQMLISRMSISGFFFGERTFNYEGQSYVYDKTNNFFSDMLFGPIKTSMFGANSDPDDYVSGKIYKVNKSFAQYYKQKKPNIKIQKQHIVDTICQYNGVWTQYLNIDKKTFLNFKSSQPDSPYYVQPQKFLLKSDSSLRDDLKLLIDENIPKAQQAKQRMEQQQRRDRKLRKEQSKQ